PRELERAAVPVRLAGRLEIDVLASAFQPVAGARRPAAVELAILEGGDPCGATTLTGARLTGEGEPEHPCQLSGSPRYIGLHARARFDGAAGPPSRAMMSVPQSCPVGTTECTAWYST